MAITELQLGLQMHRDWNGGLLFGRVGWEAQWYDEGQFTYSGMGLMGAAFSLGIMR
jgi:hypothetical protein